MAEPDFCRVCFGEAEPEKNVNGYLVAPCNCTGSVQYIHMRCLRTWQATQRSQGQHDKANLCELCGSKYVLPRRIVKQEADARTRLQSLQLTLKRIWHWLNAKSKGRFSQEALRYWRNALLVAGLYKATLWGIVGLVAGGQIGVTSASRGACCLARCAPGLMVAAMVFPRLQVPLMMTSIMAGCGLAAGAATLAMAGAYCGAFYGFFSGALGFMKWAAMTHLETAAVGGKCVTLTISAAGRIAVAVGLRLLKFSRKTVLM